MLRTLRSSSPALVVSIIALVIATAGTATAATKILIKSSSQVRAGTLDASDLSAKARKALKGNAGVAGPAGSAGAAGPVGPAGARGPSEAFAARPSGINAASCPPGGCDPLAVIRTLALPAGSFLVTASADLAPTTFVANASYSIECHLSRTDTDAFQRALHLYKAPANAGVVNDQTVDVSWALTLPAPTTMSLSCGVGGVKHGAANARITALQVGSLTEG
jgi:hypothetical protein